MGIARNGRGILDFAQAFLSPVSSSAVPAALPRDIGVEHSIIGADVQKLVRAESHKLVGADAHKHVTRHRG